MNREVLRQAFTDSDFDKDGYLNAYELKHMGELLFGSSNHGDLYYEMCSYVNANMLFGLSWDNVVTLFAEHTKSEEKMEEMPKKSKKKKKDKKSKKSKKRKKKRKKDKKKKKEKESKAAVVVEKVKQEIEVEVLDESVEEPESVRSLSIDGPELPPEPQDSEPDSPVLGSKRLSANAHLRTESYFVMSVLRDSSSESSDGEEQKLELVQETEPLPAPAVITIAEKEAWETKRESLEMKVLEWTDKFKEMQEQRNNANERSRKLERTVERLQIQKDVIVSKQVEINELQQRMEEFETKATEMTAQLQEKETQVEQTSREVENNRLLLDQKEKEIERLKAQLSSKEEREYEEAYSAIEVLQNDLQASNEDIATLHSKLREETTLRQQAETERNQAQSELLELESDKTLVERRLKETEGKLEYMTRERDNQSQMHSVLQSNIDSLQKTNDELRQREDKLKEDASQLRRIEFESQRLKAQLEELNSECDTLKKTEDSLRKRIQSLSDAHSDRVTSMEKKHAEKVESLRMENSHVRGKVDALQKSLRKEMHNSKRQIETLKQELMEEKNKRKEMVETQRKMARKAIQGAGAVQHDSRKLVASLMQDYGAKESKSYTTATAATSSNTFEHSSLMEQLTHEDEDLDEDDGIGGNIDYDSVDDRQHFLMLRAKMKSRDSDSDDSDQNPVIQGRIGDTDFMWTPPT